MIVSSYQPGLALASGDAEAWSVGILRITCSYEAPSGGTHPYAVGTGFVIADWPGLILTARHVVVLPPAISASKMSVVASATNGASLEEVSALGVAYPQREDLDVGVILIAGAATNPLRVAQHIPRDNDQIDGKILGYLQGATEVTDIQTRIQRSRALLREARHAVHVRDERRADLRRQKRRHRHSVARQRPTRFRPSD